MATTKAGRPIPPATYPNASGGDITFNVDIPFGTADEAAGTAIFATFYRGNDAVGYIAIPSTVIGNGDTVTINADSINFNSITS